MIIEGCGSLNSYTASITPLTVWFDVPEELRKLRTIERDGDKFMKYWDGWAAQELDFLAQEKSQELASFILR